MTTSLRREHLQAVLDALQELCQGWNDAAADGDRGHSHDALALVVFPDGHCALGTVLPFSDFESDELYWWREAACANTKEMAEHLASQIEITP